MIENIFVTILSSATVGGIIVFFLKKYIDEWLSFHFDKRKALLDKGLEIGGRLLETEVGVYPEILELVYRSRNSVRDAVEQNNRLLYDLNVKDYCSHLTEHLYKYKLFISDDIFDLLHQFKRILQDCCLLFDKYTRPETLADAANNPEFPEEDFAYLTEKSRQLDQLYVDIDKAIKDFAKNIMKG